MTSTALVLYAPVQTFNESCTDYRRLYPEIRYRPPGNTCDPRYAACTQHRVACDCREAHMAEDRAEMRAYSDENKRFAQSIDAVLAIHRPDGVGNRTHCPACLALHPCPTRTLLAPLSWRELYLSREDTTS